jgi:hypothetical protein
MGVTYEARQVDTVLTSWLASCGLLWQHHRRCVAVRYSISQRAATKPRFSPD